MEKSTPLYFSAPATLSVTEGGDIPRQFSGIPYSGGLVRDWGIPVVIDLSSTTVAANLPLLRDHRRDEVIGITKECSIGMDIKASGDIFSDIDDDAREIALKATRGIAWQMSVGLFDATMEDVPPGKTVVCNGAEFTGPIAILRNGIIREVSIVALGADRNTSADFFHAREGNHQELSMTEAEVTALKAQISELGGQNAELGAKLKVAEERAATAENSLKEAKLSARTAEVKALFESIGKQPSEEVVAAYLSVSDDAWATIAKDLKESSKQEGGMSHLFSEQAQGDAWNGGNRGMTLNTAEIYAARSVN